MRKQPRHSTLKQHISKSSTDIVRAAGVGDLSPRELEALCAAGFGFDAADGEKAARSKLVSAAAQRTMIDSALSSAAVASMLRLSVEQVRRRIRKRELWAIKIATRYALPFVQFHRADVLPGWPAVFQAFDERLSPLAIANWMVLRTSEFAWAGRRHSPREWLIAMRPVDRVVSEAKYMGCGMQ